MSEGCVVCKANRSAGGRCDHGEARVLGEGSYGQVFLCKLPDITYVEKVLKVDASRSHEREISCLSQSRHPNIVQLLHSTHPSTSGKVTVRMEYCQGGDLFSEIEHRRATNRWFTSEEVMSYMCQLLLAIHYLHTKSILHRDIKTSNIFLCDAEKRVLKLGDFGCSVKSDMSIAEDERRTLCGTWANVAPELLAYDQHNKAEYGRKAETWSAGIVMYELMTLRPPFVYSPHDDNSLHSMLTHIASGYVPPIPLSLGHPQAMIDLCLSMLTLNKHQRPFVPVLLRSPLFEQPLYAWANNDVHLDCDGQQQIKEQCRAIAEPHGFAVTMQCSRVRTSSSEIIPAEIGITDVGNMLYFRDVAAPHRKKNDWNTSSLIDCTFADDEFEDAEDRTFYGVCVRPNGLNPVTFGSFNKQERDSLRNELVSRSASE